MSTGMKPTRHAIKRYIERVKPAMDAVQAREDLDRMIPMGRFIEKPDWLNEASDDPRPDHRFYELVEGIVLAVAPDDSIVTVLTQGGLSPQRRKARNKARSMKRHAKRIKGSNNRDPRSYQP